MTRSCSASPRFTTTVRLLIDLLLSLAIRTVDVIQSDITSFSMSIATLAQRQTDSTRQAILDAALATLERGSLADLTARAVAKRANIAERTGFRYFSSRARGLYEQMRR